MLFVICMEPTDQYPREDVGEVVRGVVGIGEEREERRHKIGDNRVNNSPQLNISSKLLVINYRNYNSLIFTVSSCLRSRKPRTLFSPSRLLPQS